MHLRQILEISNANTVTGRRKIRAVIHEIYDSTEQYNKNGISWNEQYTLNNLDSVKGMPICVEFIDYNNSEPFGHGMTGIKDGRPLYEDSVMVGVFEEASVETLSVKDKQIKALVGMGYINEQRYPLFVRWLIAEMHDNKSPEGSVEICAKSDQESIIYDGGWKEKGRVPQIYDYTGYCILGIEPADDSAVVLELNQHHKKEEGIMDEKIITELNSKLETKTNEINSLQNTIKDKDAAINELNHKVEEHEVTIAEKDTKVAELNATIEEKDSEIAKITEELNELREAKKKLDDEKLVNELNQKLSVYSDDEQALAKENIEKFKEEPTQDLLNNIISEINNAIAVRVLEQRKKDVSTETNSKADDIYGDMYDSAETVTEDDLY